MDTDPPPPHCHFDKSGAAKSHSPMVCSIATGDLSTQRFNSPEVFIPIPPCHSARDDGAAGSIRSFQKGGIQMTETPTRHFVISTEAERSGEISRLKWQKRRPATRHFDRSEAKWRNLTPQMAETPTRHSSFRRKRSRAAKSHFPMVHAHGGRQPVIIGQSKRGCEK